MATSPSILGPAAIASLAAGLIFLAVTTMAVATSSNRPWVFDPGAWQIAQIAAIAILIGFTVAILPVLCGIALMRWVGQHNPAMRHPAVWAMAGAASGAMIGAVFGNSRAIAIMAATAAGCALVARCRTCWD